MGGTMHRSRRGVALWVAAMLLIGGIAGCSGTATPDPDKLAAEDTDDPANDPRAPKTDPVRLRVSVTLAGTRTLAWTGEQTVHITRAGGPGRSVNLLTAGFMEPEILPDDPRTRFRWAFDLINQYADAPGTFTIHKPAEATAAPGQSAAPAAPAASSAVYLTYMHVKDSAKSKPEILDWEEVEIYEEYRLGDQPCTVEIGASNRTGKLHCPELAGVEHGGKVSLDVQWGPL